MLTSLLAAAWVGVTFESKALRVPVLLERLSPVVGRKLVCDTVFSNEVMIVGVTDVAVDDLLAKIARASTGVWEKDGDRLMLRPDGKRRAEQERQRTENREKRIQAILDRCARELKASYKGETPMEYRRGAGPDADYMESQRRTPVARLGMRLLLTLGVKELAAIQGMDRRVYAINPNAMQRPLPNGGDAALAEFRKEWAVRQATPYERKAGLENLPDIGGSWRFLDGWTPEPETNFEKVWISVSDILGQAVGERPVSFGMLNTRWQGLIGSVDLYHPPAPSTPISVESDDRALTYEPATDAFSVVYQQAYNSGHPVTGKDSEVGKLVLAPDFEPLAMGSELYLQFAKAKGLDLVSLVNDNSLPFVLALPKEAVKVSEVEKLLRRITSYELDDGWLVTAPSQPAEARRTRDDRKVMRQVILDASDGKLSLGGEAAYIVSKPYAFTANLSIRLAAMFDPSLSAFSSPQDELQKRVFGLLPEGLRKGGRIAYGQASKDLQLALRTAVYAKRFLISDQYPEEIVSRMYASSLSEEVTYLLPDDIAADRVFDVEVQSALEIKQSSSKEKTLIYGGEELLSVANNRFFQKNPDLIAGSMTWPWADLFQPLKSDTYSMKLRVPGYYTTLRVKEQTPAGEVGPYEKLPPEFLKAIEGHIAKMNEMKAAGQPPRYHIGNGVVRGTPPP